MSPRDHDREILEQIAASGDGSSRVDRLCTEAARILDATGASISIFAGDDRRGVCASDEVIAELDELQFTLDEGPCMDAYETGTPVAIPDLDEESGRWPRFNQKALELGVGAVFAFPLFDGGSPIGSLNLYRSDPGHIRDDGAGKTIAAFASSVILEIQMTSDELDEELSTMSGWDDIHQATGKISARADVTVAAALDGMRAMALSERIRMSELASDILAGRIEPADVVQHATRDRSMASEHTASSREWTEESREARLTDTFVELADTLVDDYDVVDLLHTLTARCLELFPVAEAGILLKESDGELRSVASSSENAEIMELLELEREDGPCWEAMREGHHLEIEDLSTEDRWPAYVERALELGFTAVDAIPLRLRDERIGALNVFRSGQPSLSDRDLSAMRALADVATIGLLQARAVKDAEDSAGHLEIALHSRVTIEQAKGIVAESLEVSMGDAFELLRAHARSNNRKLADVARAVIGRSIRPSDLSP